LALENALDKCVGCQFYDRNEVQAEDKGVRWGKCRRTGPIVHPVSAKSYMVEGIWPHVRDDDWCGEWVASKRPHAVPATEARTSLMQSAASPVRTSTVPTGSLMTSVTPLTDLPALPAVGRFGSD
jgi:hypothetical protein